MYAAQQIKGVHSLERSAQEGLSATQLSVCRPSFTPYTDALLVLFNVALSNLVNTFNLAFKPCLTSNRSFSETTSHSGSTARGYPFSFNTHIF